MEETSLTIMAIIALLLSVVAVGMVFINQPQDLTEIQSDISSLKIDNSNFEIGIADLSKDISDIDVNPRCYCDVDSDDLENLEDDINDIEDEVDDLDVENCFQDNNDWEDFRQCVIDNF